MQHEIPQFIDIEDRVIGPLTLSQFIYLIGGGGLGYLVKTLLSGAAGTIVGILILGAGFMLAFFTYNGRNLTQLSESILNYLMRGKLFVWQKNREVILRKEKVIYEPKPDIVSKPKRNLKDIARGLDILDNMNTK